jgi:hypothetical protein
MSISNTGLLFALMVIISVVSFFGAYVGYTTNGNLEGINTADASSTATEVLSFIFNMVSFNIDNMPFFINIIFTIISILTLYLIYSSIRGITS